MVEVATRVEAEGKDPHRFFQAVTGLLIGLAALEYALWLPQYLTWPWWADHDVFATMALGWDAGLRPYRDLIGNNFPGTIYMFWIVGKLCGWGNTSAFNAFDALLLRRARRGGAGVESSAVRDLAAGRRDLVRPDDLLSRARLQPGRPEGLARGGVRGPGDDGHRGRAGAVGVRALRPVAGDRLLDPAPGRDVPAGSALGLASGQHPHGRPLHARRSGGPTSDSRHPGCSASRS